MCSRSMNKKIINNKLKKKKGNDTHDSQVQDQRHMDKYFVLLEHLCGSLEAFDQTNRLYVEYGTFIYKKKKPILMIK